MLMIFYMFFFLLLFFFFLLMKKFSKNFKNSLSLYECSFKEFNLDNIIYSAQFFLIALSFMLFDMEIVFFLPFIMSFNYSFFLSLIFSLFLILLFLSLIYELFLLF